MQKYARRLGVLLTIALFLSMLATASTFASSSSTTTAPPDKMSSGKLAASVQSSALNYWTDARKKTAKPADELIAHGKITHKKTASSKQASGSAKPTAPTSKPAKTAGILPTAGGYSLPHNYYSYFPYTTVGKVFFSDSAGNRCVCSGAAVTSNNRSVVDTAGHCVNNGARQWYSNWIFCPQYYYGSAPYGCWSARQLWTSAEWYYNGSFEDDFGEAVMSPNAYGYIVNRVGGAGWAYGQPSNDFFLALGYPAAYPYDGNSIYYCYDYGTGHGFQDGAVVSINCNMTGGSSGGPWMISIGNTYGYVNGHNDFKYTNDPNHMFTPYYDSGWYAVYNAAQNS